MKKQEVIDTLSVIQKTHFQEATKQIDKEGYPGNRRAYLYNVIDPDTEEFYPPPYLIELAYKHATNEVLNERFFAGIGIDSGHFDQLKSFDYLIEEKIDPARIDKSILKMKDRAKLFKSLMNDTDELFKHASLDNAYIKTAVYEEKRWTPVKNYQPVVLLRHLILEQIKANKTINDITIEGLKQEIIKKELGKYKLPDEYMEQVNKYPVKKRSVFHQWKSPFAIMYPLFYSKKLKQQTKEQLLNIGNLIIDRLELSDTVEKNTVGFEGAQNYGADAAWLALYPKELPSVQHAYQLFVIITKNGIEGGLYPGHKVGNKDFQPKTFNFKNIEDCIDKMKSVHDEWKKLNQEIMESKNRLSSDEMAKLLAKFLEQTKTKSQKTKEYDDHKFQGLDIVAGFGKGHLAKIPWIGVVKPPNKIIKGIYPVFLLFKEINKLILAYGLSEEEDPDEEWSFNTEKVKIKDWHNNEFGKKPYRYGESFIHSIYDVDNDIDNKQLVKDLLAIINDYKKIEFKNKNNNSMNEQISNKDLNTIFFGPPGTGKTYHTINKAVEICDPIFYKDNNSNRDALKKRYRDLVEARQVVFTTFHQSTSYEDFIEGIKPKMDKDNGNLEYQIEDGIFKEISQKAKDQKNAVTNNSYSIEISKEKFDLPVNKISLGDANDKEDDVIVEYCLKNDCIALGFGEDIDFSGVKDIGDIRHRCQEYGIDINGTDKFTAEAVKRFLFLMKKGQLVIISNGNRKLRAIGEITGDYFCDPATPIRYSQFRKVNWLYKDLELPIKEIYGSYFSQQTIYQMHSSKFDLSYFSNSNKTDKSVKNHVIIIDEINRGNVSSIFGELITLIEPDKREGNEEELSATLPYSKECFEVPNNLYIIGTMNTADRSVEALDTALRRRFAFEEMLPKPDLLKDSGNDLKISLEKLLKCINNRIEALIDRDHTIGHSYLINVNNLEDLKLAFKDKIIPLLQEYFYGDYGKIGLVLGGGFVKMHAQENEMFADFEYDGSDGLAQNKFELITINEAFDMEGAIETLLNNSGE